MFKEALNDSNYKNNFTFTYEAWSKYLSNINYHNNDNECELCYGFHGNNSNCQRNN